MTDFAPLLERAFDFTPAEGSCPLTRVEGEVPGFLHGTYYVNGPGRFRRGELAYRHWLDGDGLVSSLAFDGSGVRFTSRFVESAKRSEEEAADRPLYRTFGTAFEGDRLLRGAGLASPVNVSAYRVDGDLLAFGEQGLPWALDPETLDTRGEHDFGRLSPVTPFSAHPHFDPETGEMVNFGVSYSTRRPALHLYRFGPGGDLLDRRRLPLDLPYSVHDFSLSRRWAVFHLAPYLLDMGALLAAGATVQEALSWQPERGSRLLVMSRESGEAAASVAVGRGYCLHQINAFEEEGRLFVDLLELPEPVYPEYQVMPELFTSVPPARTVRLVVDVARGELVERRESPFPLAADFPSIDPRRAGRRTGSFPMLAISATGKPGRKFFDRLVVFDQEKGEVGAHWQAPPLHYLGGEPVFVPDPASEGAGAVICQQFDAERRRSAYLVFDARRVGDGPAAVLRVPEPQPPGFHASFAAEGLE